MHESVLLVFSKFRHRYIFYIILFFVCVINAYESRLRTHMREGYGITDRTVVVPTFVDDLSSKIARKFGRISHISAGKMY